MYKRASKKATLFVCIQNANIYSSICVVFLQLNDNNKTELKKKKMEKKYMAQTHLKLSVLPACTAENPQLDWI